MDQSAVDRAAALIARARRARVRLGPLPEDCRPIDEADAYRVQASLNRMLTAAGAGRPAGHKIGCTTPVMQAYLDIRNPCSGVVFAPTVHRGTGEFRTSAHLRLGVECEIAVELATDLPADPGRGRAGPDRDTVAAAVGAVVASIEVVEDRYEEYRTLGTPTLIADDFFNAGVVLGTVRADPRRLDLGAIAGRMLVNGSEVGSGRGSDILGDPLAALAWLAASMASRGERLRAGEFVSLGSLVTTQWVQAGDVVRIELDGLGAAAATFV